MQGREKARQMEAEAQLYWRSMQDVWAVECRDDLRAIVRHSDWPRLRQTCETTLTIGVNRYRLAQINAISAVA